MGWFAKFMFVLGIGIYIALIKFEFSDTIRVILLSVLAGIIIFVLFSIISGLRHMHLLRRAGKDKSLKERIHRRRSRNRVIGVLLLIISIIVFLNSYLYIKSMLGNDMQVSLKVDKENIVMKNGEEVQLNVNAKVLTNPFCSADCSIILEDLSKGIIINSENIYLKVSSPLLKEYIVSSNNENFGQTLYKISLDCKTIKSRLCYVKDISKFRSKIISVDYELSDNQREREEGLKNETENITNEFYRITNELNQLNFNFSFLDLSEFNKEYQSLNTLSNSLLEEVNNLDTLYENQEYAGLERDIQDVKVDVTNLGNRFENLNSSLVYNLEIYNALVNNLRLMYYEISYFENSSFSDYSISDVRFFVKDFNSMILELNEHNSIETKVVLFSHLKSEEDNILSILESENNSNISMLNPLNLLIYPVNLSKILIEEGANLSSFTLNEPLPICCLKGECYKCIDDSSVNYPVILVHGHSFNEKLSAELSMESFSEMAKELEGDDYLNVGYFYRSQYDGISRGYLGRVNSSIVVEATYYLDTQVIEEGSFMFDSKLEDIDTYASRLNEVINNVKYITGKDKVIIIAHSMGSLVTRRYIKLYGEDSLDRVILIGGPNHGVDGLVLASCPVFGADVECNQMNKSSSFLYELNHAPPPSIPVYNIIGLGCLLEGSDGDGIVKAESAYLDWAENIYFTGTCSGVDFFHVRMIKPSKHPEIYAVIRDLIKGEN